METIKKIFFELDKTLVDVIAEYGTLTYIILFAIIFVETGLVVMPFLPGDSLLFVAGSLSAVNSLNIYYVLALLLVAAFLGDSLNYFIGRRIGEKVLSDDFFIQKPNQSILKKIFLKTVKKEYLDQAQEFYEKHGGKAIVIARFIPIVRTFAPFIAGVSKMNYRAFLSYNILGAILWIVGVTMLGFFFGNIPFVKSNFKLVIILIILISILPAVVEYFKHTRSKNK